LIALRKYVLLASSKAKRQKRLLTRKQDTHIISQEEERRCP